MQYRKGFHFSGGRLFVTNHVIKPGMFTLRFPSTNQQRQHPVCIAQTRTGCAMQQEMPHDNQKMFVLRG